MSARKGKTGGRTPAGTAASGTSSKTSSSDTGHTPPTMQRSRPQLATAYAPGKLFSFEGGKGICRSIPVETKLITRHDENALRQMIFDQMREYVASWQVRAFNVRDDGVPVLEQQACDHALSQGLLNDMTSRLNFTLMTPKRMGYQPWPLLFRCEVCGYVREFESVTDLHRHGLPNCCAGATDGHVAAWRQVDVVYAHWSGRVLPLSPNRYDIDKDGKLYQQKACRSCGGDSFRLDQKGASFSQWDYVCIDCGDRKELIQNDPESLRLLSGRLDTTAPIEYRMLPVSYRASSLHYVHGGRFIVLAAGSDIVSLMGPDDGAKNDLVTRLGDLLDLPMSSMTDDEIKDALIAKGMQDEWDEYEVLIEQLEIARSKVRPKAIERTENDMREMKEEWSRRGLLPIGRQKRPALEKQVRLNRVNWATRYDPIRLTVEHDAFLAEHVTEALKEKRAFDVLHPDRSLFAGVHDAARETAYRNEVRGFLDGLGIQRMVLIKGLPLCEYTFGYTRVSALPLYIREHQGNGHRLPVCLNAFPPFADDEDRISTKHPVYVLEQSNEAFYVKLDEARVRQWLEENGVPDLPPSGESLRLAYLEQYEDFGMFLDRYKARDSISKTPRRLPDMIYMLLHSLSHQMIHGISALSGLDIGSIGEYIFPADLGFVVYRRGMTPDLGSISALWRDSRTAFLSGLVDPRQLRCGSGSLCDTRGGACPACIMIPEVSCIAGNNLLSRATLAGGPPAHWDAREDDWLEPYFRPVVSAASSGPV